MKTIQIHTPSFFQLCYILQLSPHLFLSIPVKDSSFLLHDAVSIAEYLQNTFNNSIDESAGIAQIVKWLDYGLDDRWKANVTPGKTKKFLSSLNFSDRVLVPYCFHE